MVTSSTPNAAMKFQPDVPQGPNVIQRASHDTVIISGQTYLHSVLVPSDAPVVPWPVTSLDMLTAEHMALILPLQPELVILGSGPRLRFPHPSMLQALMAARIGVPWRPAALTTCWPQKADGWLRPCWCIRDSCVMCPL
jgi:uncharacterized protein